MICGLQAQHAALSRIDYLCGTPNEMEVSEYDVHCNEGAVVEHVKSLRDQLDAAKAENELLTCGFAGDGPDYLCLLCGKIGTEHITVLRKQLETATKRAEALEKDAARYRWLRNEGSHMGIIEWRAVNADYQNLEQLDAAIDVAISKGATT